MVDVLPDDHVETAVLRNFAYDASCAVVGAYKGATMRYLFDHKARAVHGVEPQKWAYDLAVASLVEQGPHNWELDNLALVPWATEPNDTVRMYNFETDGCTILRQPRHGFAGVPKPVSSIGLVPAMNVIDWLEDRQYDFMVMNIEGGEYMILPWLAMRTTVLLVQYHGPPMPFNQLERICEFNHETMVGKGWVLYT